MPIYLDKMPRKLESAPSGLDSRPWQCHCLLVGRVLCRLRLPRGRTHLIFRQESDGLAWHRSYYPLPAQLIKHEIYDDAGDGYIHPQWERPAGSEAGVLVEFLLERARERHDYDRHIDYGQHGVGNENDKVKGTNKALALEGLRADVVVVDDVAREK